MRIALTSGDPAGIGPEIALKAARDPKVRRICTPVLVGDPRVFGLYGSLRGVEVLEVRQGKPRVGELRAEHGAATIAAAQAAIRAALRGEVAAVVGAPHTETAIHAAGIDFDGYPSFVARAAGCAPHDGILMLCFRHRRREVRIAHVTLHAGVADALKMISKERIVRTLRALEGVFPQGKFAVSGVNPHAGEGGAFGREEIDAVYPAIEAARTEGIAVDGPIGADTLIQRTGYDAYAVMLHDQGHIAAKLLAPRRVAGLTIGTPVLFSSVAHGSALDIAGKGRASPAAMVEAITRLVSWRRRARLAGKTA